MSGYALLQGSEEGRPLSFLTPEKLRQLLDDPYGYAGIREFVAPDTLDPDPNYWPDDLAVLLKYDVVMPVPAGSYRLPDESEETR